MKTTSLFHVYCPKKGGEKMSEEYEEDQDLDEEDEE